jgi:DNA-binding beta-propeller fold protein YncE
MMKNVTPIFLMLFGGLILSGCNNPFTPPKPPRPGKVLLATPRNGSTLGPGNITMSWHPMPKFKKYRLQVSKSSNFGSCVVDTTTIYTSCFRRFGLEDTVKHFWQVKVQTKDFLQWSEWSDVWTFVIDKAANRSPYVPQDPTPPDSAASVSANTCLYWWSGDPDGDTVVYTVYLGTDSILQDSIGTIAEPNNDDTTLHEIGYCALPSLNTDTKYYWKIKADDQWEAVSLGPVWHFTTASAPDSPPVAPTITMPAPPNYIDEEYIFKVKTTDPEGDAVRYWFDFGDGTSSGWSSFVPSGQSVDMTYTYRSIGEFYVKAKAQDTHYQDSEWSDSAKISIGVGPGAVWIADPNGNTATKIGRGGSIICRFQHRPNPCDSVSHPEFRQPLTLCVDPLDACVWIACTLEERVFKRLPNATRPSGFTTYPPIFGDGNPSTPSVDNNGDCWFSLAGEKRFVKLHRYTGDVIESFFDTGLDTHQHPIAIAMDYDKDYLWAVEFNGLGSGDVSLWDFTTKTMFRRWDNFKATNADVDPITHYCWVADMGNGSVAKIKPPNGPVTRYPNFTGPTCVSVDPNRDAVWVADKGGNRVVKISKDGSELCAVHQLNQPSAVKVDPSDGSCWISDPGNTRVIKVTADCTVLFEINSSRFATPMGISLNPNPEP